MGRCRGCLLVLAATALSGCYYDPGYSYVRGNGYGGDAYYGTAVSPAYVTPAWGSAYYGYGPGPVTAYGSVYYSARHDWRYRPGGYYGGTAWHGHGHRPGAGYPPRHDDGGHRDNHHADNRPPTHRPQPAKPRPWVPPARPATRPGRPAPPLPVADGHGRRSPANRPPSTPSSRQQNARDNQHRRVARRPPPVQME